MNIVQYGLGKWGRNHNRIIREETSHDLKTFDLTDFKMPSTLSSRPDAVLITCSSVNHFPILMDCLYSEIPVYCEKPICTKKEQVGELLAFSALHPNACMMGGFQLLRLNDLAQAGARHPRFFTSDRTGAIPRTEGAVLSLAVHDIAMAYYVFGFLREFDHDICSGTFFDVTHANGNHHHAKLSLSLFDGIRNASILVQSISHIRLRHTSIICDDGSSFFISPDNWSRPDLLSSSLELFLQCAENKMRPPIANLPFSSRVMKTAFDCMEKIDAS